MPGDIQPKNAAYAPREALNAVQCEYRPFGSLCAFACGLDEIPVACGRIRFEQCVLAGDWTNNGFNAGCVEAATMSGIQAANAIRRRPLNEGIEGPLVEQLRAGMAAAGSG